jgi:hypothetical protein
LVQSPDLLRREAPDQKCTLLRAAFEVVERFAYLLRAKLGAQFRG